MGWWICESELELVFLQPTATKRCQHSDVLLNIRNSCLKKNMHQLFGKKFFGEIPHEFHVGKFNSSKGHRQIGSSPQAFGVKTTINKKKTYWKQKKRQQPPRFLDFSFDIIHSLQKKQPRKSHVFLKTEKSLAPEEWCHILAVLLDSWDVVVRFVKVQVTGG